MHFLGVRQKTWIYQFRIWHSKYHLFEQFAQSSDGLKGFIRARGGKKIQWLYNFLSSVDWWLFHSPGTWVVGEVPVSQVSPFPGHQPLHFQNNISTLGGGVSVVGVFGGWVGVNSPPIYKGLLVYLRKTPTDYIDIAILCILNNISRLNMSLSCRLTWYCFECNCTEDLLSKVTKMKSWNVFSTWNGYDITKSHVLD